MRDKHNGFLKIDKDCGKIIISTTGMIEGVKDSYILGRGYILGVMTPPLPFPHLSLVVR